MEPVHLAALGAGGALLLLLGVGLAARRQRGADLDGWWLLGSGAALLAPALAAGLAPLADLQDPRASLAGASLAGLAALAVLAAAARVAGGAGRLAAERSALLGERDRLERELGDAEASLAQTREEFRVAREHHDRVERTAEGTKNQWQSLVENAPSLILTVDREGTILFANRPPPGVEGPHALGASLFRVVPPEHAQPLRGLLARVFLRGEPAAAELCFQGAGGPTWWLLRVGPVRREGSVVSAVVIATDITDLKRALEARRESEEHRRAVARLEELNAYKTQLLDTAAHELSNPLQAIHLQLTMLKVLGTPGLGEKQQQALEVMKRNFRRLRLLVQDMRDLTRIQSGKLRIAPAPADLAALAQEAVDFFQEQARGAGVALEARAAGPVPLEADPDRLAQVLFNLVSNAIKFTPAGGLVRVEAVAEGDHAVLRVRDTGRGLAPEQVAKLFKPFSQVHDTSQAKEKGTGLGLYICKNLVEAHGGRIGVESEGPGLGSTFTVVLPRTAPRAEAPLPAA